MGKTSLSKSLQGLKKNRVELSTDGIEFGELKPTPPLITLDMTSTPRGNSITLKLWDFAGQDIFYFTHSFYLSNLGIYLIVWNIYDLQSLGRAHYWISVLFSTFKHTQSSISIFLVATHVNSDDALLLFQSQCKYFEKYSGHLIQCYPVDSYTNFNIPELKEELFSIAEKMVQEVPKNYLNIAYNIEQLRLECENKKEIPVVFISKTNIYPIDQQELKRALSFLHDIGKIIYFNQEGIDDMVILDCNWLNNAMKSIITLKYQIAKSDGLLSSSKLSDIWKKLFPPNFHNYLFEILSKFDVIQKISDDQYFIPMLLSDTKPPEQLFSEKKLFSISRGYKLIERIYPISFLPVGLIARMQSQLSKVFKLIFRWKDGCVAKKNDIYFMMEVILDLQYKNDIVELEATKDKDNSTWSDNTDLDLMIDSDQYIRILFKYEQTNSKKAIPLLRYVTEMIKSLCCGWFHLLIPNSTLCIDSNIKMKFRIQSLLDLFSQGKQRFALDRENKVVDIHLSNLIPDLIFEDLWQRSKIDINQLEIKGLLGKGAYGIVYKGNLHRDNSIEPVAIKLIHRITNSTDNGYRKQFESFIEEILLMSQFQHTNLINLIGFGIGQLVIDQDTLSDFGLFAVLELIEGTNLDTFLHDPVQFRVLLDDLYSTITKLQSACILANTQNIKNLSIKCEQIIYKLEKSNFLNKELLDCCSNFFLFPSSQTDKELKRIFKKQTREYTDSIPPLSKKTILRIAIKISKGIQHLHSCDPKIIHRDLKSDNCLISFRKESFLPKLRDQIQRNFFDSSKLKIGDKKILLKKPSGLTKSSELIIGDNIDNDAALALVKEIFSTSNYQYVDNPVEESKHLSKRGKIKDKIEKKKKKKYINQVKICDFGTTAKLYNQGIKEYHYVGALQWVPPEIFDNQPYTTSSDIYSLAIIFWELLHREAPYADFDFTNNEEIFKKNVKLDVRPTISMDLLSSEDTFFNHFIELIRLCWHSNPSNRPSISTIITELSQLKSWVSRKNIGKHLGVKSQLIDNIQLKYGRKHLISLSNSQENTKKKIKGIQIGKIESKMPILCAHFASNSNHSNLDYSKVWIGGKHGKLQLLNIINGDFPIDQFIEIQKETDNAPSFLSIIANSSIPNQLFAHILQKNSDNSSPHKIQILQSYLKTTKSSNISDDFLIQEENSFSIISRNFRCKIVQENEESFIHCQKLNLKFSPRPPLHLKIEMTCQNNAFIPSKSKNDEISFLFRSSNTVYQFTFIDNTLGKLEKLERRNRWIDEICKVSVGRITQSVKTSFIAHSLYRISQLFCDDNNQLWIFGVSQSGVNIAEIWKIQSNECTTAGGDQSSSLYDPESNINVVHHQSFEMTNFFEFKNNKIEKVPSRLYQIRSIQYEKLNSILIFNTILLDDQSSMLFYISLKSQSQTPKIIAIFPNEKILFFSKIIKSYFSNYIILITENRKIFCVSIKLENVSFYKSVLSDQIDQIIEDDFNLEEGFGDNKINDKGTDTEMEDDDLVITTVKTFEYNCSYSVAEESFGFLTAANVIKSSIWLGFASGYVLFSIIDFTSEDLQFHVPHGESSSHQGGSIRDSQQNIIFDSYEPLRHTETISQILEVDNAIWSFSFDSNIIIWK